MGKLRVVAGCRRCLNVQLALLSARPASRWMVSFIVRAFSMDVIRDRTLQGFRFFLVPLLTPYRLGQLSDPFDASASRMAWTGTAIVASIGMPILERVQFDQIGLIHDNR